MKYVEYFFLNLPNTKLNSVKVYFLGLLIAWWIYWKIFSIYVWAQQGNPCWNIFFKIGNAQCAYNFRKSKSVAKYFWCRALGARFLVRGFIQTRVHGLRDQLLHSRVHPRWVLAKSNGLLLKGLYHEICRTWLSSSSDLSRQQVLVFWNIELCYFILDVLVLTAPTNLDFKICMKSVLRLESLDCFVS